MKKILKNIMSLSYPFCKHGSANEEIVDVFRKINNLAHEAEILIDRKKSNDYISNGSKERDN